MTDYVHYRIESQETLDKIHEWQKEAKVVQNALEVFFDEYCSKSRHYVSSAGYVKGVRVTPCPDGWIQEKGCYGYYRPHARKAECKTAFLAFKALPRIPGGDELAEKLGLRIRVTCPGGKWCTIGLDILGDTKIIIVPVGTDGVFDKVQGGVEMKMSEYYALKEKHDG